MRASTRATSAASLGAGRPRVAFVTQWFPPEPVGLPLWMARSLEARGADVHVITGVPNYPHGRVLEGYSAWRGGRSSEYGLRVSRAPLVPSHSASVPGRVANYLSFAAGASAVGRRVLASADVALVYGSPATAAIPAALSTTPYVMVVQDLWPDSVFATNYLNPRNAAIRRTLQRLTDELYQRAAHVVAISPGMRDVLIQRGLHQSQVSVVHNWVDESVLHPVEPDLAWRASLGIGADDLLVLYAGAMGTAQSLTASLDAMAMLRERSDIHLVLVGSGTERRALEDKAKELDLSRVMVLDPVAIDRIPGLVTAADLNLVSLADRPLFEITLPSKIQGVLACGGALVGAVSGDAASLIRDSGAGLVVGPEDPSALADMFTAAAATPRDALRELGRRGRRYYTDQLSEAVNAERLMSLLIEHARPRKAARP